MLPLSSPPSNLASRANQKLLANPIINSESIVPKHPKRSTGLRPTLSESDPHATPVRASARAKEEMRMPAYNAAFLSSPARSFLTIGYAYGKMEVRAMGSANHLREHWFVRNNRSGASYQFDILLDRGVSRRATHRGVGEEIPRTKSWKVGKLLSFCFVLEPEVNTILGET